MRFLNVCDSGWHGSGSIPSSQGLQRQELGKKIVRCQYGSKTATTTAAEGTGIPQVGVLGRERVYGSYLGGGSEGGAAGVGGGLRAWEGWRQGWPLWWGVEDVAPTLESVTVELSVAFGHHSQHHSAAVSDARRPRSKTKHAYHRQMYIPLPRTVISKAQSGAKLNSHH